jgi:2-amino-4-hydroxy-6-hydroxymethyldihydropteridine diphosphokinase
MTKVLIALGSNLGNRRKNLKDAVEALRQVPGILQVNLSKIYETEPVGGPEGQKKYFNAAAEVETALDARALKDALLAIENKLGRVRLEKNGPRTIDLDLIFYGNQIIHEPGLTVPHPKMQERWFVLKPLADLAPDFRHPVLHKTVEELLGQCREQACLFRTAKKGRMRERKPNRLINHDYAQAGYYFVTVCTSRRVSWFGTIKDKKMILNEWGRMVQLCWNETPRHFAEIKLDEFVTMPNHIHGILIVKNQNINVGNRHACSLRRGRRQCQTVPLVVESFKSAVSRLINKTLPAGKHFRWQKSYHDRIIRAETELNAIREYIQNNPLNWETDPDNLSS